MWIGKLTYVTIFLFCIDFKNYDAELNFITIEI